MGIGKRLSTSTADLASALPASEVERNGDEKAVLVRTAPGQLLAIHSGMSALQNEVQVLQERLKKFDGALVTRQIDPTSIRPSRWANRHEASFATPAFESLKASIALAGGNAQPILVREHLPDQFEIVFGHRRHRACLELGIPVLAVVSEQSLGDIEVFLSMEQENRERADLSPFEKGRSYVSALESGLFPSQRRLAEAVGVSHTWLRKSMLVAQLPEAVIQAFRSPLEVQPKHAEVIVSELEPILFR
jgi:ParB family chromosome partitioning protein